MLVKETSQKEFDNLIKNNKVVVVDFHAVWCGPCKMLSPSIEKLAGKRKDILFIKIDVDKNQDLVKKLKITAMPTVFLYIDGQKINSFVGYKPEPEILNFIEQNFS